MPELATLEDSIAIRPDHVARRATTIYIKQHTTDGGFTISKSSSHRPRAWETNKLFLVEEKRRSLSQTRYFQDASGLPLFELNRKKVGVTWFVQLPGGDSPPLVTVTPKWRSFWKDKIDIHVHNAGKDGQDVHLEVRGQDMWKINTHVYFDGALVMKSRTTDVIEAVLERSWVNVRPEWEVEVAKGMDLSLASVIMVSLAHLIRQWAVPTMS